MKKIQNTAPSYCALQNKLLLGLCVNTIRSRCVRAGDTEPNRDQRQQMTPYQASLDETRFCFIYYFLNGTLMRLCHGPAFARLATAADLD